MKRWPTTTSTYEDNLVTPEDKKGENQGAHHPHGHLVLSEGKKKERNLFSGVPLVKKTLLGTLGEKEDNHPTLMTLKSTFRSLKAN